MTVLCRDGASRCCTKPTSLMGVFMGSSGTLTGNIQLFFDVVNSVSSSFGYFSLSPCFPKLSLLASDEPLGKNFNYLHASPLPQIHCNTRMSFAPTISDSLQANLLYSSVRSSRGKARHSNTSLLFPSIHRCR